MIVQPKIFAPQVAPVNPGIEEKPVELLVFESIDRTPGVRVNKKAVGPGDRRWGV